MILLYAFIHFTVVAMACHPQCRYQCDDPVCSAVCQPVCATPNCEIVYKVGDGNYTTLPNYSPTCTCSCANDGCEADQCPQCQALCEEFTSCPEGAICEIHCLPIQAYWYCQKPKDCPLPSCQSFCEQPSCQYEGEPPTSTSTVTQVFTEQLNEYPEYSLIKFNSSSRKQELSHYTPLFLFLILILFILY